MHTMDNGTTKSGNQDLEFLNRGSQAASLDLLFPGYGIIVGTISQYLGFDLSLYVPFFLILGLSGVGTYFVSQIRRLFENYLMANVEISPDDEIYNILMSWVARQSFASNSRQFIANLDCTSESQSKSRTKALSYTPSFGTHLFWYKSRPILFSREKRNSDSYIRSKREEGNLRCFGYSPAFLKNLLKDAHEEYIKIHQNKTMIYRAELPRRHSADWHRCMALEPRHISTIITRPGLKESIIDDITDYLSTGTRRWYTNCGIPWRRGYLFVGPPGTGKSSFSLALASYFRLRIYTISLSSAGATEENLASLFSELPQECIVLFEDVDAAGLTSTRATTGADGKSNPKPTSGSSKLSLSGLLNLLDGVASQEGRILIMSTNHVENLDKALIRPGRVDMTIQFTFADSYILREIFQTVFSSISTEDKPGKNVQVDQGSRTVSPMIKELSTQFAARIPSGEFTPAEVQGYLIRHKRQPEMAVSGVEEWVLTTRLEKAARKPDGNSKTEGESEAKLLEDSSDEEESDEDL